MKGLRTCTAVLALAFLAGCESPPGHPHGKSLVNDWLVQSYSEDAIRNAIIVQHTLYPYHFDRNGATLNELGRHDLSVLIEHFKRYPGRLNVRRGDEDRKLHSARVQALVKALKEGGVQTADVEFAEALPGGDGMASERVAEILIEQPSSGQQAAPSSGGSTTATVSQTGTE